MSSPSAQFQELAAAFRNMKAAFVPAMPPGPPPGQPPMDPAMAQQMQQMPPGQPPMDPSMAQQMPPGQPPMDPSMAQQMPPGQPAGGPPPELAEVMSMMDQLVTLAEQHTEQIKALEQNNANLEKALMQLQLQMEALSKQIEETGSEMPRMLQDLTEVKALQNMQQQPPGMPGMPV